MLPGCSLLERERRLRQRRVQHSLAAVDIPVPLEWVQMDLVPHTRISQYPPDKVRGRAWPATAGMDALQVCVSLDDVPCGRN